MPAKDIFHDAVRNALIKDGWTITHDPYPNGKIYIQHDGTEEGIADRLVEAGISPS